MADEAEPRAGDIFPRTRGLVEVSALLSEVTYCRYCWRLARHNDRPQGYATRGRIAPDLSDADLERMRADHEVSYVEDRRKRYISDAKTRAVCELHLQEGKVERRLSGAHAIENKIHAIEIDPVRGDAIRAIAYEAQTRLKNGTGPEDWTAFMAASFPHLCATDMGRNVQHDAYGALKYLDELDYKGRKDLHRRIESDRTCYSLLVPPMLLRADLWCEVTTKQPVKRRVRRH